MWRIELLAPLPSVPSTVNLPIARLAIRVALHSFSESREHDSSEAEGVVDSCGLDVGVQPLGWPRDTLKRELQRTPRIGADDEVLARVPRALERWPHH